MLIILDCGSEVVMRKERNEMIEAIKPKRVIRFPSDEELDEFLDDALQIAQKAAAKYDLEVEDWMVAEAICQICPEIRQCDQQQLVQAVARVLEGKWSKTSIYKQN